MVSYNALTQSGSASTNDLLVVAVLGIAVVYLAKNEIDQFTGPLSDILGSISQGVGDIGSYIPHDDPNSGPIDQGLFDWVKGWGDDDAWFS